MEESEKITSSAEKLAQVVDKLDKDFMQRRTWWYSFSHGLLQGIGIALGATVFFVIIFYGLLWLETMPVIGDFVARITDLIFVENEILN